jgi:hypothetical protein
MLLHLDLVDQTTTGIRLEVGGVELNLEAVQTWKTVQC